MGLLEDAIREHLELKRLRGADPTEVAREQHEALDPPAGQQPRTLVEDHAHAGEHGTDAAGHEPDGDGPAAADHADDVPQAPIAGDASHAAQETAELDMQAVLADEPMTAGEHAVATDSDPAEGREPPAGDEDSLEWEVPARPSHDAGSDAGLHEGESHEAATQTPGEHQSPPDDPAEALEDGHAGAHGNTPGQGRLSL
jgi:hypothetical protein